MEIKKVLINIDSTLFETLKKMDQINKKLLIVCSNGKFESVVSIGDIQRGLLNGLNLDDKINNILRSKVFFGTEEQNKRELVQILIDEKVEFIPIISKKNEIIDVLFWEQYSDDKIYTNKKLEKTSVFIMAGGLGTRLKPLTNIIPKALVPVGEKPIIQIIIERFIDYGCENFYISVNYKGEMIERFLKDLNLNCNFFFLHEKHASGTAGSLSLLNGEINDDFFITNCDIIIDQDYVEVLKYHKKSCNQLTAISAIKDFSIPYGVLETDQNGKLVSMTEKPNFKFQINAGIYIINPLILKYIPRKGVFHITDLINLLQKMNESVGVFPVSSGSWFDIGNWKDYQETQDIFNSRF
jgi:dTDP-glucose pyrophosphorylase